MLNFPAMTQSIGLMILLLALSLASGCGDNSDQRKLFAEKDDKGKPSEQTVDFDDLPVINDFMKTFCDIKTIQGQVAVYSPDRIKARVSSRKLEVNFGTFYAYPKGELNQFEQDDLLEAVKEQLAESVPERADAFLEKNIPNHFRFVKDIPATLNIDGTLSITKKDMEAALPKFGADEGWYLKTDAKAEIIKEYLGEKLAARFEPSPFKKGAYGVVVAVYNRIGGYKYGYPVTFDIDVPDGQDKKAFIKDLGRETGGKMTVSEITFYLAQVHCDADDLTMAIYRPSSFKLKASGKRFVHKNRDWYPED